MRHGSYRRSSDWQPFSWTACDDLLESQAREVIHADGCLFALHRVEYALSCTSGQRWIQVGEKRDRLIVELQRMLDDVAEEIRPVIAGRDHHDIAARGMTGGMVHRYTGSDRLRVGGDRLQPTVFAGDLHPLHRWVSG